MSDNYLPEKSIEIDLLRIFCCMMVVMIHALKFNHVCSEIVTRAVIHCAVPCFMGISGYLIFFRREYEYKQILSGPFKRYFIIFLLWLVVYMGYYYSLTDRTESFWSFAVINSEGWHLWYLKVYLQIIFVYPLVKAITSKKKLLLFYAVLWFLFISLRYTAGFVPGIEFSFLRIIQLPFFQYSGRTGGTALAYYPTECLGIFIVIGAFIDFLERNKEKEKFCSWLKYFVGVGAIGFFIAVIAAYTAIQINEDYYLATVTCFHFYFFIETFGVIAAIYFIVSNIRTIRADTKIYGMIEFLSDKTLGIYILHPIILSLLERSPFMNGIGENVKGGFLFGVTFIGTFLTVEMIHRILPKKIRRYLF